MSFLEQAVPLRRQADTLARLAIARSPDESLRSLAKEIDTAEQPSVTDALDRLRQWGQPAAAATPSPDPVSRDQLRQLASARGAAFDRQWRDDIGRTLTRSLAVAGTEQAAGVSPPVKATALQWYTELSSEQEKLSALTPD
ncbi:MAG TPA: DUF4142 domain-containing protein [Pseudonocardiaceae bacterium]|nr:DUF4142 domain-containing protein [Pseudonocardiaceae bacterium]